MTLEKRDLYRLPWSMNDNPIAWLEITDVCNIYCEGCYRQRMTGHKTLAAVKEEIAFLKKWRNPDNVSIAGGEPLIHPQIVEIVAHIAENRLKPIILTNAVALKPELLRELKKAGLAGFTVHIDSHQNRPHWKDKTEADLNELRQQVTDMVNEAGGLYLVFNSTVYPSTYHQIPDVMRWGRQNMGRVHGLVFITYRTATSDKSIATDTSDQQVDLTRLSYVKDHFDEKFVTGPEVFDKLHESFPEIELAGYLGGSIRHDSFKWLVGAQIGSRQQVFGSVGKQAMEVAQAGHHVLTGTYLAYLAQAKIGRKVFLLAPWDKTVRRAAKQWWSDVVRYPSHLFAGIYVQSVGIIQAPDLLGDGRADMCDSCPDITYYDGKLVNSCRLDEYRIFGGFLSVVDKAEKETLTETQN